MDMPERVQGWRFILLNIVLVVAHMLVMFNVSSYVAMAPHVAGKLGGVLTSVAAWAQTDFMVALAVAFPIARWLSLRFGDSRVLVVAFVAYAAASVLCVLSETFGEFLFSRIVLGLAGGLTVPLAQAICLNECPDRHKPVALGMWGFFTLTPFSVGFPVGGWIADELGWQSLFYWNIPLALIIAAVIASLLHGRNWARRPIRIDLIGISLFVLILGGLQTIANMGNDFDWFQEPGLRITLLVVVVAVPCFIMWEFRHPTPAFDLRLFLHRNFTIGVVGLTLGFASIFGLLGLLIVQLQVSMGYSSTLAGLLFLPMILSGGPVIAMMPRVTKLLDVRWLACFSLLGLAGIFHWIGLFDEPASFEQIGWPLLMEGLFVGAFFTPLTVLALHGVPGDQLPRAAEMVALFRLAAGALGITLQNVILFRRIPFHQLHLANHFGGRISISYDHLGHIQTRLVQLGLDHSLIQSKLGMILRQQAKILAMNDAYVLASYLCALLAVVVWFARSTRPPALSRQYIVPANTKA